MTQEFPQLPVDGVVNAISLNGQKLAYGGFHGYLAPDVAFTGQRVLQAKGQSQITIAGNLAVKIINQGKHTIYENHDDQTLTPASLLDTGTALQAGKDYAVYFVADGDFADFVVSLNASYPAGASQDTSRKVGGFHTLCVNAGTISGHPLTGYTAAAILPASVWDLRKRPRTCDPAGMIYNPQMDEWLDIYLASGKGVNTKSLFGGTITASQTYPEHIRDLAAVGKRPLDDVSFMSAALGSNQKTNISGSANPGKTGGHVDTAGRRMLSGLGAEDMCGCHWQWIEGVFYNSALNTWADDSTYGQIYACRPGRRQLGGWRDMRGGGA
jgi:hypothetical protein